MSGSNACSEQVERELGRMDAALDAYEKRSAIASLVPDSVQQEANRLLTLSPTDLSKLTPVEGAEGGFVLKQYAWWLQKLVNREQARVRWSEAYLDRILADSIGKQNGYGFQERRLLALRNSEHAMAVEEVRVRSQLRLDRISYLSGRVDALARSLENLHQTKKVRMHE